MKKMLLNSLTKVKFYYKKITPYKNKSYAEKLRHGNVTPEILNKPKKLSNEVLSMVSKLKNDNENSENLLDFGTKKNMGVRNFEEMTIRLEDFIEENRSGEKIPGSRDIMNHLNITSEKLRLKLLSALKDKGILIKLNRNTYKYNLNYEEGECNAE